MREDVLIVLNERESQKQQKAEALMSFCESNKLSCERIAPTTNISQIVLERNPRTVVLDYILGEHGSAFDILHELQQAPTSSTQTQAILWTDEPSLQVAVDAMKLGAADYVELASSRSLEKVASTIQEIVTRIRALEEQPGKRKRNRFNKELVFQTTTSRDCLAQAHASLTQESPIVVLLGERGVGRNALAHWMHRQRNEAGAYIAHSVETWTGEATSLFALEGTTSKTPELSHGSTVLLEHIEFDAGDLLEAAETHFRTRSRGFKEPLLIIGTTQKDVASHWASSFDAAIIEIPPLQERAQDILPLLQYFIAEAKQFQRSINELPVSPESIEHIASLHWPGNIKQLRASVLEALSTPLQLIEGSQKEAHPLGTAFSVLEASKQRWETLDTPTLAKVSPMEIRNTFDAMNGNLRRTAAALSIGVRDIRAALATHLQGAN